MPPRKKAEPLTGAAIVARTPRVLTYLASVLDAHAAGDTSYSLEAPADLPMDEATFVATIFAACELADAAGVSADDLRQRAATFEQALTDGGDVPAAPEPQPEPETPAGCAGDHPAVELTEDGAFRCTECKELVP
jgi:hypothetical protein